MDGQASAEQQQAIIQQVRRAPLYGKLTVVVGQQQYSDHFVDMNHCLWPHASRTAVSPQALSLQIYRYSSSTYQVAGSICCKSGCFSIMWP